MVSASAIYAISREINIFKHFFLNPLMHIYYLYFLILQMVEFL